MPDTKELESCWHDQREQDFNVAVHRMLDAASNALDTSNEGPKGARDAVRRTFAIVDEIHTRLIAEAEFRGVTKVTEIGKAAEKRAAGAAIKAIAARIHAALNARERAESTVITATLAVDQLSSDNTRHIAHVLEVKAQADIWEVYQHLQAAMELIPECDWPEGFELDTGALPPGEAS